MKTETSTIKWVSTAMYAISVVAGALFVVASLFGIPALWGLNFLKFTSAMPVIVAFVLLAAAYVPFVNARLTGALEGASDRVSLQRGSRIRFGIAASLIFVLVASITYENLPLLGDGSLRASEVLDFNWVHPTEFLDQLVHALLFQYVVKSLSIKPTICYRIISIVSGVFFIWGALKLSTYLMPQRSLFAFFAMVTSGMAVMFFGYVESYSILAGLLPWLTLVSAKVVDGKKSVALFGLWVAVAILVHSVAVFLFGLPLIAAWIVSREPDPASRRRFLVIGTIVIAAGTVAWYALAYLKIGTFARYVLPLFPRGDPGQGIFTLDHALNLLNWLFLSGLPFVVFLPVLIGDKGELANRGSNRRLLAVTMMVSSVWFLFFFVPQLGGPRDWDLFSLPTFMLIPASLLFISTIKIPQRIMRPLIPALVVSGTLVWSFAHVNASLTGSIDRYLEILKVSRFKNQWIEYSQLYELASQRPELQQRRVEFIMKAWHEPPRDKSEKALTAVKIAQAYFELGRKDSANAYIDSVLAIDSLDLDAYVVRLRALKSPGDEALAFATAERMVQVMPDSARALREAGMVCFHFGQQERGRLDFEAALKLAPNDYLSLMNLGSYYLSGDSARERSIDYLARAVLQRPKDFPANFYLAMAFEHVGRLDQARKYCTISAGLVTDKEQEAAVKAMLARLSRH